jgi:hypothetical protein
MATGDVMRDGKLLERPREAARRAVLTAADVGRCRSNGRCTMKTRFATAAVFVVVALAPVTSRAEPPPDDAADKDAATTVRKHPFFAGGGIGIGYANVSHPQLSTPHMVGPVVELHAGYTISPEWAVSLELTNFEQSVSRNGAGEQFHSASTWGHVQAGCEKCGPPETGGWVKDSVLLLTTAAPRVDFTPLGPDGPFVGATGGVALLNGLDARTGVLGAARAGFRLRPVPILAVQLEGGVQGEAFSDASAMLYYGELEGRLHF